MGETRRLHRKTDGLIMRGGKKSSKTKKAKKAAKPPKARSKASKAKEKAGRAQHAKTGRKSKKEKKADKKAAKSAKKKKKKDGPNAKTAKKKDKKKKKNKTKKKKKKDKKDKNGSSGQGSASMGMPGFGNGSNSSDGSDSSDGFGGPNGSKNSDTPNANNSPSSNSTSGDSYASSPADGPYSAEDTAAANSIDSGQYGLDASGNFPPPPTEEKCTNQAEFRIAQANAVADSRRKRIPEFLQLLDQIKAQNFPAIIAFIKQAQPTFLKAIGDIDNKLQLGLTQIEKNMASCKESIKEGPGNASNESQGPNSAANATNEVQEP